MTPAFVKLADPTHKLPWPNVRGRVFSPEGETVDIDDPFWSHLLIDGSIVRADAPTPAKAAPAPNPAPPPVA